MSTHAAALNDFVDDDVVVGKGSKILLRKKKEAPKEKHIHMILKGESITRLEELQAIVQPHTQTGAITAALQLFEVFVNEYQDGSEFYIKREGDKQPVKHELFG